MTFQHIGDLAESVVRKIDDQTWDGKTITKPGIYNGITLRQYHERTDLLDGPSVSKSILKHILPTHGGSPKAFWGRWQHNPDHITQGTSEALIFGSLCHCLMLNDEPFSRHFIIRPENLYDPKSEKDTAWNGNRTACKEWIAKAEATGRYVVTPDQIERAKLMSQDAAKYPEIEAGLLNGDVERSYFAKDSKTGIWMRVRPDVKPLVDATYADLKSTSSLDEDFLTRQIWDAGYYLQGAMTRMVCRELDLPFEQFILVYVLNNDVPDTAHVPISDFALDRGEEAIRYALDKIKECLDAGTWHGAEPFNRGERPIDLKDWNKKSHDDFFRSESETQSAVEPA